MPRFQAVTKFQAHNKYLTRCLLSPDVKYANLIQIISCNRQLRRMKLLTLLSRYLATCSADTTVKIWSISQNYEFKLEKILQGHQRWVWDCAFSADSAYLLTGGSWSLDMFTGVCLMIAASSDHTARLWKMATGEEERQYKGHHKGWSTHILLALSLKIPYRSQLQYAARCTMVRADENIPRSTIQSESANSDRRLFPHFLAVISIVAVYSRACYSSFCFHSSDDRNGKKLRVVGLGDKLYVIDVCKLTS